MSTKVTVTLVALIVALLTNGAQFFYWKHQSGTVKEQHQLEIQALQERADSIGDIVTCYTVSEQVYPGQLITEELITEQSTSEYFVNDSYFNNPADLIGKYFKVGMLPGTPITTDNVMTMTLSDSLRDFDIVAAKWPIGTKVGDYVDLRITYPYGEDYLVLSHLRVQGVGEATLKVYMTEEELQTYQAALVDWYLTRDSGTSVYLTKYVEPGLQASGEVFYKVPENVRRIMKDNPNIVNQAAYAQTDAYTAARHRIESAKDRLTVYDPEMTPEEIIQSKAEEIQTGRQEETEKTLADVVTKATGDNGGEEVGYVSEDETVNPGDLDTETSTESEGEVVLEGDAIE